MPEELSTQPPEQTLPLVPKTPPVEASNGTASSSTIADRTTRRLDDLQQNRQDLIEFIEQAFNILERIRLIYQNKAVQRLVIGIMVFVGGITGYLVHQPNPPSPHPLPKPTPIPTAIFSKSLEGVDMAGYCTSLGYNANREQGYESSRILGKPL